MHGTVSGMAMIKSVIDTQKQDERLSDHHEIATVDAMITES
jgi:hypothetical protein